MLKSLATLAIMLIALILGTKVAADDTFKATLTGDQEVPPVGPVATDTTGRVRIQINKTETEGEFTLIVNEGVRVTQAHLHCGAIGVNGPIVVFLAGLHAAGLNVDGKWIGNAAFTDSSIINTSCGATVAALTAAMRAGNVYANVHTVAHPQGEIRGQVEPTGQD